MPNYPDWWQDHLAHLRTRPSAEGLRAMARAVSPGSRVERVRRFGGGISTATSGIRLRRRSGQPLDVVLKRFRKDGAKEEWRRLVFARRLAVPTPEPLVRDDEGEWFGTPALVMRKLPGRADVRPKDIASWVDEIARVQIAIHAADARRVPAILREPRHADGWQPPRNLPSTPLAEEAAAKLRRRVGRVLDREPVVAHGDAHPGNLLWSRGRITGVTDWRYTVVLPRGHEVAYMRADIAVLLGLRAADAYAAAYERLLGRPVQDLPTWDLVCGLDALAWCATWVRPYREQGAVLTHDLARRHATAFLRRALSRI